MTTVRPVRSTTTAAARRLSRATFARMIIDVGVVVNVRDVRNVRDVSIGDVYAVEVSAAHSIPREVRFPIT